MKVAVCVPWRASDPHRTRVWRYVRTQLEELGLGPILTADACHQPFNRAASRNAAVRTAIAAANPDVLILHDADTMLRDRAHYHALCKLATDTGRLVVGADREYRALTLRQTDATLAGTDPWTHRVRHPMRLRNDGQSWFPVGGVLAITPHAWATVGGQDERFAGWGCEDTAFAKACGWMLGHTLRAPGDMLQLWHPPAQHTSDPANSDLWNRYGQVRSRYDMVALLTEPGGPLHTINPRRIDP